MRDSVRSFAKIAMSSLITKCGKIDPQWIAKTSFDIAYEMEIEHNRRKLEALDELESSTSASSQIEDRRLTND